MAKENSSSYGYATKRVADATPGPWKSWPKMSRHARAIRFIETYCRTSKGEGHGQPLKLAGFQKDFLEQALADGTDAAILATPRGNGKSTFGAAMGVWATYDDDETGSPQVPIVATTIGQAIRSCYGVAVSMIKDAPELLSRSLIYTGIAVPRVVVPFNGAEFFPLANDPDGLQGLDFSLALFDEIGFQPVASWDALQMATGKRSRSLAMGMGTPGFDRDSALWHLRQLVHEGGDVEGLAFVEFAAPDGCEVDDRAAWKAGNPAIAAGFLNEQSLANLLKRTHEGPFRVFRLGQWVDGVDAWLGANGYAIWEGLTSPYDFQPKVPTYVGVDIALKHDTSAVVWMQKRDDGRFHAACRIWMPSADRPVDTTDVMQHLRNLADQYRVEAISFDPRFFDVPAKMLSDEGLPVIEVPQSVERMTAAYGSLYEAILGGKITHDGDDAFTAQILNGVPRFSERGFMLEKGKSRGKIDAATALALAYDQALRHEDQASRYEERGLLTV